MDARPDVLEAAIDRTRHNLDRDLSRLGRRIDTLKERAVATTQWWVGVSAVTAGLVGAVVFWPKGRRRVAAGFAPLAR
jgi:hypothetical protein